MTSELLLYNTKSNLAAFTPEKIKDDFTEYARARCLHPNRVKVFNSVKGCFEVREMPCGHCIHCRSIKQSEWVTRAYSHLEDNKYAYFVTLTYRGFTPKSLQNPINAMMLDYLSDAYYHLDSQNSTHCFEYSPSVLVKSHFQKFLKRLRFVTNNRTISFMMCGEYGYEYARPHAHYILFSNEPISYHDICRAWSVHFSYNRKGELTRNPRGIKHQYKLIGKVDYHALYENGTITNQNIIFDGHEHNAHNCFAYVCKYIGKDEANYNRLWQAYYAAFDYNPSEVSYKSFHHDFEGNVVYTEHNEQLEPIINIKPNLYVSQTYPIVKTYPFDFLKKHAQFHEVSRGTPIGSLFLSNHLQEFTSGNFFGSSLQSVGYVTPSYFRRKVAESLYSLRLLKKTDKSISPNKGNLPLILHLLERNIFGNGLFGSFTDVSLFDSVSSQIEKSSVMVDLVTRERFIAMCDCFGSQWIDVYKYNRILRDYEKISELTVHEFCRRWFTKLKLYIHRALVDEDKRLYSLEQYEQFKKLFGEYLDSVAEPSDNRSLSCSLPESVSSLFKSKYHQTEFQKFSTELYLRLNNEYDTQQDNYHLKHNRKWNKQKLSDSLNPIRYLQQRDLVTRKPERKPV